MTVGLGGLTQGVLNGYTTGLALNRQDKLDAQAAQEHDLRMQSGHEQLQAMKGNDDYNQQVQQQNLTEQGFKTNLTGVLRKVMPLVDSGSTAPAMSLLEHEYNNNPAFQNGYSVAFQKDANGVPVADKDGNYTMTLTNPDGVQGKPTTVAPKDAVLHFANMESPLQVIASERATAAQAADEQRKLNNSLTIGAQKIEGDKSVANIRAKSDMDVARIHAATAANAQKFQLMPAEARLFTFYRSTFPKKTDDEVLAMVRTSKGKSDQQQRNEMAIQLLKSGEASSLEEAAQMADKYVGSSDPAVPLQLTPPAGSATPAASGTPVQKDYSKLWGG